MVCCGCRYPGGGKDGARRPGKGFWGGQQISWQTQKQANHAIDDHLSEITAIMYHHTSSA